MKHSRSSWILVFALVLALTEVALSRWVWSQGHFDKYFWFVREALAGRAPWHRLSDLSPGYLLWVALCWPLTQGDWWRLQALQLIVSLLGLGLWCRRISSRDDLPAGATAAVLLLLSRPVAVFAGELEPEFLVLLTHAAGLWLLVKVATDTEDAVRLLRRFGLVLALAFLARPAAVVALLSAAIAATAGRACSLPRLRVAWLALAPSIGTAILVAVLLQRITGVEVAMDPGAVLYEGNHPAADGASPINPWLVEDLAQGSDEPDAQHLAYVRLAGLALGGQVSRRESSAYWAGRVLNWYRHEPSAALTLLAAKQGWLWGPTEVHDLRTSFDRERSMGWFPPLTWAVILPVALLGLWFTRGQRRSWILAAYLLGHASVLTLFYASARQRVVLWPALAWLAALALVELKHAVGARAGLRPATWAILGLLALAWSGAVFEQQAGRQQRHLWLAAEQSGRALQAARRARLRRPAPQDSWPHQVNYWLWDPWALDLALRLPGGPRAPEAKRAIWIAARRRLASQPDDWEIQFDTAVLGRRCGRFAQAERLLAGLARNGYRPLRPNRTPRTIYYEWALCALQRGDAREGLRLLERAAQQAPGDLQVLALLRTLEADPARRAGFQARLAAMHDPTSIEATLALALLELGDAAGARRKLTDLSNRIPEWRRGRVLLASRGAIPGRP